MNQEEISTRPRLIGARVLAALTVCVVALTVGAGGAFAQVTVPADPTGGQMATTQASVQTWVTTYGAPVLFGLILLGILIRVGVKWSKKAASGV